MTQKSGAEGSAPRKPRPRPWRAGAPASAAPASAAPAAAEQNEVEILGAESAPWSDLYHLFLRVPWPLALLSIVFVYLGLNVAFAVAYWLGGGITNADGSFVDAFYFSVQTMGTIGYGFMYPATPLANGLVVAESVAGLIITALATGLVFAKFSRSTARVGFSNFVTIGPMNGLPTVNFRVGNRRGNLIMEATVRVSMVRTERTAEGVLYYRMYDLKLVRERSQAFSRSWNILHAITADSPLFGYTPERMAKDEVELIVSMVGTDDTSLQPVHARQRYVDGQILWGARPADILSERPDGRIVMNLRKFHEVEKTEPVADFPYSWEG